MIEPHYLKEIKAIVDEQVEQALAEELPKQVRQSVLRILRVRFGPPSAEIVAGLEIFIGMPDLERLADWAEACPDLASFCEKLPKLRRSFSHGAYVP